MPSRTRFPRVAIPGARIQFANTIAELVNLSPTGALIRMNFELRKGGEWPLVLDLDSAGGRQQVWLHGRVVRCRPNEGAFVLALSFVAPNAEAQAVLNQICSQQSPEAPKEKRPRPLPWKLPAFSFERLLRLHWAPTRQCPECHSGDISKERRHEYSCFQCGCRFNGYRLGKLRISL
ncbi:MAG TPA: PilZ domain-containing protein [Vicinamibacterales bacterium]|nr:PilZ domain-containing protein [Vicinamibacterales bacterium]